MKKLKEWAGNVLLAAAFLFIFVGLPLLIYFAIMQSRDCQARGGYQSRDLGCIDLKKIQIR